MTGPVALLAAKLAAQYFAGQPLVSAEKPEAAALAATLGEPKDWGCKVEKKIGVADEPRAPSPEWDDFLAALPAPEASRRASADAYWGGLKLIARLQSEHEQKLKASVDQDAVRLELVALMEAQGKKAADPGSLDHYAKSVSKRLREVAASVGPRVGWTCRDVERAQWVLQNGVERLTKKRNTE